VETFVFQFDIQKYKIKIYRALLLSLVVYGCENLSLTLRGEHRLRVFDNIAQREIFGPNMAEVNGD
jgi:hypothetical protein